MTFHRLPDCFSIHVIILFVALRYLLDLLVAHVWGGTESIDLRSKGSIPKRGFDSSFRHLNSDSFWNDAKYIFNASTSSANLSRHLSRWSGMHLIKSRTNSTSSRVRDHSNYASIAKLIPTKENVSASVKTQSTECDSKRFKQHVHFQQSGGARYLKETLSDSPLHCCMFCETSDLCTCWTWHNNMCLMQSGKVQIFRDPTGGSEGTFFGRVSLNKFIDRTNVVYQRRMKAKQKYLDRFNKTQKSSCEYDAADHKLINSTKRPTSYILINEPRSGSSWLQEISQMHPGLMVQFELDLEDGERALLCQRCRRSRIPDSKHLDRIPLKTHPPIVCGMTIFGSANSFSDVAGLATRHNATVVLLLRKNHVAHAISLFRHFNDRPAKFLWQSDEFVQAVLDSQDTYERLVQFATHISNPVHFIFYEDMKYNANEVWVGLQHFLGLPIIELGGIDFLERPSTDRPAVEYLYDLEKLQAVAAAEAWAEMATQKNYDNELDVAKEFRQICRQRLRGVLPPLWSWRGGVCENVSSSNNIADSIYDYTHPSSLELDMAANDRFYTNATLESEAHLVGRDTFYDSELDAAWEEPAAVDPAIAATIPLSAAPAVVSLVGAKLPPGTYIDSCSGCELSPGGVLSCFCEGSDQGGRLQRSSVWLGACSGPVDNRGGELKCH